MAQGRSRIKADETKGAEVRALSRYGVPLESIAAYINVSVPVMRKIYSQHLAEGRASASREIGKTIYEKAVAGDMGALVFWAKTQMGWRETAKGEVSIGPLAEVKVYRLPDNGRD